MILLKQQGGIKDVGITFSFLIPAISGNKRCPLTLKRGTLLSCSNFRPILHACLKRCLCNQARSGIRCSLFICL